MQKVQIFFRIYEVTDQSNCILKKIDLEVKKEQEKGRDFLSDFEEIKSKILKSRFVSYHLFQNQIWDLCFMSLCMTFVCVFFTERI